MNKLKFYWDELKATFWFVPVIILIISVFLATGFVYLDGLIKIPAKGPARIFFVNNPDSARSILTTISSAMIGVAGTVFSITLVALSLASSQFGSRLIKNFMYVRLNQIVLGSYVSTYLYCLLVLNAVRVVDGYTFTPSISIFAAIIAALLNIILLIIFIHQIAQSIQVEKIISDISINTHKQAKSLFPKKMGEEIENERNLDIEQLKLSYTHSVSIKCPANGYIQYVDKESLIKSTVELDALLELQYRPGRFVVEGMEIGVLFSNEALDEDKKACITDQFVIGKGKTLQQDLEFPIHQMVEIAVRALSPGVNDPYTAMACIDNLTSIISFLATAQFPSKYRFDEKKKLRVIADNITFEGALNAAFHQIRQYSAGNTAVIIRLMEALTTIHTITKQQTYKQAIINHAEMVLRVGESSITEKNDLEDLAIRAKLILGSN